MVEQNHLIDSILTPPLYPAVDPHTIAFKDMSERLRTPADEKHIVSFGRALRRYVHWCGIMNIEQIAEAKPETLDYIKVGATPNVKSYIDKIHSRATSLVATQSPVILS